MLDYLVRYMSMISVVMEQLSVWISVSAIIFSALLVHYDWTQNASAFTVVVEIASQLFGTVMALIDPNFTIGPIWRAHVGVICGHLGVSTGTLNTGKCKCWRDYSVVESGEKLCRPLCDNGSFSLPGMRSCLPWLTCEHLENHVQVYDIIGFGAVKQVRRGIWNGYTVTVSTPIVLGEGNLSHRRDFEHGMDMLIRLGPSERIVQLIGYCHDPPALITEHHKLGSSDRLQHLVQQERYRKYDTLKLRFGLCVDYASALSWLHRSTIGTRVMCDSNDLNKTLSQYLLTDDFRLVLNDVDALPSVTPASGVKCGHRQLFGDFVAPEQLWPYGSDTAFEDERMPGYDEKTDVWKMPRVCEYFLSGAEEADLIRFRLFGIHQRCKCLEPSGRPTAEAVLREYEKVWRDFFE